MIPLSKTTFIFSFILLININSIDLPAQDSLDPEDTRVVSSIFSTALADGETYRLLDTLCHKIGHRLSGSKGAKKAVQWTRKVMKEYKFDNVRLQQVTVPHWERGDKEVCQIIPSESPEKIDLRVLAIGGSVGTPENGITAEVIEVFSLNEVDELGEAAVRGKIVFYNRAFDQTNISSGSGYGGAVDQRARGASRASRHGAVAIVIRSVTSAFDDSPHTGTLIYAKDAPKIPAAALGFQSADRLAEHLKKNKNLNVHLKMNCEWFPDAQSHNVLGELRGSEKPDKIIVVGGHLDSWDVGHGAHDDGAGCMQSIMVLRTFQKLDYKPKHTVRAVMFMNEENGTRGGNKYAEVARQNNEKHLIALKSDAGGFSPRGFGVTAPDAVVEKMRSWLPHFDQRSIVFINKGGGGVDIRPLNTTMNVPLVGLSTDNQRLFDYHHSELDVFENVNRRELELGTAAMAALIYLIDMHGLN